MKRIVSVLLVVVLIAVVFSSCNSELEETPIEKASAYVEELNDSFYERCSWFADVKRIDGFQIFVVEVVTPYDTAREIPGGPYQYFKALTKDVGPKIESLLENEKKIDIVWILLEYENREYIGYYYENGKIINENNTES